jgi:hypothetical protein
LEYGVVNPRHWLISLRTGRDYLFDTCFSISYLLYAEDEIEQGVGLDALLQAAASMLFLCVLMSMVVVLVLIER